MNEIAKTEQETTPYVSAYQDANAFDQLQRVGKMLSQSLFVPKDFQGKVADCAIAANVAFHLKIDPVMVLQNIHVIHGKPGFSSTFIIALINRSGKFAALDFKLDGKGDQYGCNVVTVRSHGGATIEGPRVDVATAKAQGWWQKSGSKWPSMTELMLKYRAAAFFARLYCPEVLMGFKSEEEVIDIEGEEIGRVQDVSFGADRDGMPVEEAREVVLTAKGAAHEVPDAAQEVTIEPPSDALTPQDKLRDIVCNEAESDWQTFKEWAVGSNQFTAEEEKTINRFSEVPEAAAKVLIRAKKTLIKQINALKK
tara:strand:+ start:11829 stop:12758 length:930 start_codon:yes stop_codon:yes gene_type:complete